MSIEKKKIYRCESCESEVNLTDSYCGQCGSGLEPVQDQVSSEILKKNKTFIETVKRKGTVDQEIKSTQGEIASAKKRGDTVTQKQEEQRLEILKMIKKGDL